MSKYLGVRYPKSAANWLSEAQELYRINGKYTARVDTWMWEALFHWAILTHENGGKNGHRG